jgi:hypothetical protein
MEKDYQTNINFATTGSYGAVVNVLLKGGKVHIPEFGYLEPFSISGRKTVLFKLTEKREALKEFAESADTGDPFGLYERISLPLIGGNTVNISDLGVFHPIKTAEGSHRISYTISPSLRKSLNDPEPEVKKPLPVSSPLIVSREEPKTIDPVQPKTKEETTEEKGSKTKLRPLDSRPKATSKVGDVIIPPDNNDNNFGSKVIRFVPAGIVLAVLCVLVYVIYSFFAPNSGEEKHPPLVIAKENKIDLTELAEKNYGNRAFWIYIYYANRDKLSSPVNIPEGVNITIPDLKEEYNINLNDTADIRQAIEQANVLSGIVLK